MDMIEIEGLQKISGSRTVLDIEDLTVEPGQVVAVVGPAGSGVDTLFEILIGRIPASAGSLRLAGINPQEKSAFSRQVGILFAEDALYQRQSPRGNLLLICQLYGLPKARAETVLAQMGMSDLANAKLSDLSSSLLRRLAFGRAILHSPPVLLLYEPFARCDEDTISLLKNELRRLAEAGASILILADDPTYLDEACDVLYTLNQGRLAQAALPEQGHGASTPFKIPARMQDKVILVNPGDILFAEAESGRACLQTAEGRMPTQFTLSELEERLARSGFFRAHRSYLVNLQHVKEVIPYTRNSFSMRLDDPQATEIPLSKTAAGELRDLLGY
jgi:ABC-2 type transport system ATP-binding protein